MRLQAMRKRLRAAHPTERLILVVDQRPVSPLATVVIAVPANSPWFDLLPEEQIVELKPDERRRA